MKLAVALSKFIILEENKHYELYYGNSEEVLIILQFLYQNCKDYKLNDSSECFIISEETYELLVKEVKKNK